MCRWQHNPKHFESPLDTMVLLSFIDLVNYSQMQVLGDHNDIEFIGPSFPHLPDLPPALAVFISTPVPRTCIVQKFNHFLLMI